MFLHREGNVAIETKFSLLAAPQLPVVFSTIYGVTKDESIVKMAFPFLWTGDVLMKCTGAIPICRGHLSLIAHVL